MLGAFWGLVMGGFLYVGCRYLLGNLVTGTGASENLVNSLVPVTVAVCVCVVTIGVFLFRR